MQKFPIFPGTFCSPKLPASIFQLLFQPTISKQTFSIFQFYAQFSGNKKCSAVNVNVWIFVCVCILSIIGHGFCPNNFSFFSIVDAINFSLSAETRSELTFTGKILSSQSCSTGIAKLWYCFAFCWVLNRLLSKTSNGKFPNKTSIKLCNVRKHMGDSQFCVWFNATVAGRKKTFWCDLSF